MGQERRQQAGIRAVYMRGGTSRAVMFRAGDLPQDPRRRDAIFLATIGSPDPAGRQLNGLGGGISSLSKVAVVGPSTRADADVDYTFAQVAVKEPLVQYRGNCGNISSAVGPFAVDEGMIAGDDGLRDVRIHNTNTGKIIVARFDVAGGAAKVDGDFALDGVAGTGAPIRLSFREPGGAVTGKLLPTGVPRETLQLDGGNLDASLVDASNPVAFVEARALGLIGAESPEALSAPALLARFEEIRVAAAVRMGIVNDATEARTRTKNVPFVCLVSAPQVAATLSGAALSPSAMDITVRMISAGQPHRATPLTAAMCLAVAAKCEGTIPHALAAAHSGDVRIAHPSGILPVAATVRAGSEPFAEEAVVTRTARRLMEGRVLVPSHLLD